MNEILLCTERGIYAASEHIVGIVYVKVYQPMGIKSISIQLLGNIKVRLDSHQVDECIIDKSFILAKSKVPLPIGCHAFPFMITLPPSLDSSMYVEYMDSQCSYSVETSYRLIVRGVNSRHLRAEACIYLYRHKLDEMDDKESNPSSLPNSPSPGDTLRRPSCLDETDFTPELPKARGLVTFSGLRKSEISLGAVLNKPVYEFGEKITLQISLRNTAHKMIHSISVKLIRVLELSLPRGIKRVIESVLWGHILPSCEADVLEKVVSVQIPIPLPTSQEFSPTTFNAFVKCYHVIDVIAPIANGSTSQQQPQQVSARVRIPCIVPHNNPFWTQKPPAYWCEKAVVGDVVPAMQIPRHHLGSLHFAPSTILQHFGISKF